MFRRLVSRNADVARLADKGYALAFDTNHLIVRDVPYLDGDLALAKGALVAKVDFVDADLVRQTDHQVYFAGGVPHDLEGRPIANLGGGETTLALGPAAADVVVQRSFSNKPPSGAFADFFAKFESYVGIVSGPAMEKYSVSPLTGRIVADAESESVFKFPDTLTSRAEIQELAGKVSNDVVAMIGLGGTGAYVLDYLVKTPVRELRGFDHDTYCVHNAFRSPGSLDPAELGNTKASVYQARYESFRHELKLEFKRINRECVFRSNPATHSG